jgi:outer membrane protein OmpA-like peptidoglycan-associated protein
MGLCGCAPIAIGIGAGAGAIVYSSGELVRTYKAEYHRAVDVSEKTLQELKIPLTQKIGDELKSEIKAIRTDGSHVTITAERIDWQHTQISIRVGTIGIFDREVSIKLHEIIEEKILHDPGIQKAPAKLGFTAIGDSHKNRQTTETPPHKTALPEPKLQKDVIEKPVTFPPPSNAPKNLEKEATSRYIIFFSPDSSSLQEKSKEKLEEIAAIASEKKGVQLSITGYPDSTGSEDYKRILSQSRAITVRLHLMASGVDPSRSQITVQKTSGEFPGQGATIEIIY